MVHLFEETIAGRAYRIEVRPVSEGWRAQLKRTAGMSTAMMPFYGRTPIEAASHLTAWLRRAHAPRDTSQPPPAPRHESRREA